MCDWGEKLWIYAGEPSKHVRINLIGLSNALGDQSKVSGVRDDHLVPPLRQQLAQPARMRPNFKAMRNRWKISENVVPLLRA